MSLELRLLRKMYGICCGLSFSRLRLQVIVLGSRSTGRKTLVNLWQNSSISSAVSQFADVELRVQVKRERGGERVMHM